MFWKKKSTINFSHLIVCLCLYQNSSIDVDQNRKQSCLKANWFWFKKIPNWTLLGLTTSAQHIFIYLITLICFNFLLWILSSFIEWELNIFISRRVCRTTRNGTMWVAHTGPTSDCDMYHSILSDYILETSYCPIQGLYQAK